MVSHCLPQTGADCHAGRDLENTVQHTSLNVCLRRCSLKLERDFMLGSRAKEMPPDAVQKIRVMPISRETVLDGAFTTRVHLLQFEWSDLKLENTVQNCVLVVNRVSAIFITLGFERRKIFDP